MTIINNVHGEMKAVIIERAYIQTKQLEELYYQGGHDTKIIDDNRGGCEFHSEEPMPFEEWVITRLQYDREIQQNILNLWNRSTNTSKN